MRQATPVLPGHETLIKETVIGVGQPQYDPLPAIIVPGHRGEVITRWELTDQEKILLLSGGHIYLSILTYSDRLQPIMLRVATPEMVIDEQREVELPRNTIAADLTTSDETPPS